MKIEIGTRYTWQYIQKTSVTLTCKVHHSYRFIHTAVLPHAASLHTGIINYLFQNGNFLWRVKYSYRMLRYVVLPY